MVLRDAPKPVDPHIFVRGNPGRPGKAVPRQFLKVLAGPDRKPFASGSGRLELARGHRRPRQSSYGTGTGQPRLAMAFRPGTRDHAQRLWPAQRPALPSRAARRPGRDSWIAAGRSRRCTGGSCYPAPTSRAATRGPTACERDPQNRLLWRYNRQRLDFEAMRDSVLAVAGTLDTTMGGPSIADPEPPLPTRRTVYGFIDRQNLDGIYRTFDFAVPDATSPKRFVDHRAPAGPLPHEQPVRPAAGQSACRVPREREVSPGLNTKPSENRVCRLYRRVLGRSPEPSSSPWALRF